MKMILKIFDVGDFWLVVINNLISYRLKFNKISITLKTYFNHHHSHLHLPNYH